MPKNNPQKPDRRRAKHREAKARILEEARVIMREQGVAGLTLEELASRLDMQPPSLYNYFDGKTDIYDQLFRQGFMEFNEAMRVETQQSSTWLEDIRDTMMAYQRFALENPEIFKLCFERHLPGFEPSVESMRVVNQINTEVTSRIAGCFIGKNFDPGMPVEDAFNLVNSMMHGITAMHLANEPGVPAGEGRFGGLIPQVLSILEKAWTKN